MMIGRNFISKMFEWGHSAQQAIQLKSSRHIGLYPQDGYIYLSIYKKENGQSILEHSEKIANNFIEDEAPTLKNFVKDHHLSSVAANLILPKQYYEVIMLENFIQAIEDKHNTLKWRMAEYLDYPCEEAIVEYIVLPSKNNTQGKIYALATHQSVVQACKKWAARNSIHMTKIDVWQNAIKNIISQEDQDKGSLIVQMAWKKSELVIMRNNQIYFMRDLDIAMKDFKEGSLEDKRRLYEKLTLELQRSIDYCASNIRNPGIAQVFLNTEMFGQIDIHQLEINIGIPVGYLHLPDCDEPTSAELYPLIASGAALEYMK